MAAAFKGESDVVVAKVDCDAHKEIGERFVLVTAISLT